MKNRYVFMGMGLFLGALLLVTGTALAQAQGHAWQGRPGIQPGMQHAQPGVFGTVSAINGNSLTVESKGFGPNATSTAYTVDATNATVTKNGSSSSVSDIAVGDSVMVQGTVSGTNVTATAIRDGMLGRGALPGFRRGDENASGTPRMWQGPSGQSAPAFPQGNGQPVVGGTVSAINGSTLTITNTSNVTYTVDASSATVTKSGKTASLSDVSVGDAVLVQGPVSGSSVTASSIIDQGAPKTAPGAASSSTSAKGPASHRSGFLGGFFGGIGRFFQRIFGFF